MTGDPDRYRTDVIAFIDAFLRFNEKGEPWTLSPYQRRALSALLAFDAAGRLGLRVLLWSEPKKSGKTFIGACLVLWWAFTRGKTTVLCAANDLDQSVGRVFATAVALLAHNPALAASATVRAASIALTNGTVIRGIPSDYKGEAGGRQSLSTFDELWGFTQESAERLFEELTPVPTEPDAWLLIVTTAGFAGESVLLERLWRRGLSGERLDPDLELWRDADLGMFWSQRARQPWQTDAYYAEQARLLRPNTFRRLHGNEWVSAESRFITPEVWDSCVEPSRRPVLADKSSAVYVGVDASQKHDSTALVAVRWEHGRLALVAHHLWQPTPDAPLDLEATVEAALREWHVRFTLRAVVADPWQMARSVQTLKAAGLPIRELPQTSASTTQFGQALFDALVGRHLVLYPDDQLRQQALNTVAIESPRGFRIAKEKATRKIDAVVALAMAVHAAIADTTRGADARVVDIYSGASVTAREFAAARRARELGLPLGPTGRGRPGVQGGARLEDPIMTITTIHGDHQRRLAHG